MTARSLAHYLNARKEEAQNGCAGHARKDDGQDGPHTGAGPVDGGAAAYGQDGVPPPWLWPLLSLPS
jgi:hypothetical protein